MALHLVPILVGAAAGSLLTYLYKDRSSQEKVKSAVKNISDKVKSYAKQDTEEVVADDLVEEK
ncbi:MAG: YtxH domain-containing protein [Pseudomonadota bacterium]